MAAAALAGDHQAWHEDEEKRCWKMTAENKTVIPMETRRLSKFQCSLDVWLGFWLALPSPRDTSALYALRPLVSSAVSSAFLWRNSAIEAHRPSSTPPHAVASTWRTCPHRLHSPTQLGLFAYPSGQLTARMSCLPIRHSSFAIMISRMLPNGSFVASRSYVRRAAARASTREFATLGFHRRTT